MLRVLDLDPLAQVIAAKLHIMDWILPSAVGASMQAPQTNDDETSVYVAAECDEYALTHEVDAETGKTYGEAQVDAEAEIVAEKSNPTEKWNAAAD